MINNIVWENLKEIDVAQKRDSSGANFKIINELVVNTASRDFHLIKKFQQLRLINDLPSFTPILARPDIQNMNDQIISKGGVFVPQADWRRGRFSS